MNKYQESLNYIVSNSCPSGVCCNECNIKNICNNLVKDKIDTVQELIDKEEKYKWHNLLSNPTDRPITGDKDWVFILIGTADYTVGDVNYRDCWFSKEGKFSCCGITDLEQFIHDHGDEEQIICWKYLDVPPTIWKEEVE